MARILLTSMGQSYWIAAVRAVAHVLTVEDESIPGRYDVRFDARVDTADDVLRRLPGGTRPDLWLFTSPEYSPTPDGLEKVPIPTVAMLGDPNLCTIIGASLAPFFDLILVPERSMVPIVRAASGGAVEFFNFYAADGGLYRKLPDAPKDVDVAFVGNLHPLIHRARGKDIERLLALGDRCRIRIESNLHGEPVNELYNRAKLIYNRSVRGDVNMRVFEAAAAGTAVLYEASNPEVGAYFTDGESIILYPDDGLIEVIERYVADDAARARIAAAGHEIARARHTAEKRAQQLLDLISALPAPLGTNRPAARMDPEEIARRRMRTHMLLGGLDRARAVADHMKEPPHGDLAVLEAWSGDAQGAARRLGEIPDPDAISMLNLFQLYRVAGRSVEARQGAAAARERIDTSTCWADLGNGLMLDSCRITRSRLRWERVTALRLGRGDRAAAPVGRTALLAHVYELIGDMEHDHGRQIDAKIAYAKAYQLAGADGYLAHKLGRLLAATGSHAHALRLLEAAVELEPFFSEAQQLLVQTLTASGDALGAARIAQKALHSNPLLDPQCRAAIEQCLPSRVAVRHPSPPPETTLRILTFLWHEPYMCLLAHTGHEFDCIAARPQVLDIKTAWTEAMRPKPPNVRILDDPEPVLASGGQGYDLVLGQTGFDLVPMERLRIPKVFMSHNMLLTETGLIAPEKRDRLREQLAPELRGMRLVFISERKRRDWGFEGAVIRGAVEPDEYGGWTGEIPRVLRVGNYLRERDFMLGYTVQEAILGSDIPSTIVGQNPRIPGARLASSWDELRAYYRSHRLYLNTTIERYESGYNLSMLEAMATGMPIVALSNADSPIIDGVNGFISGDIEYLRDRTMLLLRDADLARTLGRAARETVLAEFGVERFAAEWNRQFHEAIEAQRAAA